VKALVFNQPFDMELRDVHVAPLGPGDLRVRVRHAGICGTDLRIYSGTKSVAGPRIIGHEFAGTVAELGSEVTDYHEGDRVVVYPMITCHECYACRAGRQNICVNRQTLGYEVNGGFAEYVTVPAKAVRGGNVLPVPVSLSDEEAAVSEPVAAALQGIRQGGVTSDQVVLITGAGPLGLAHVQLSRLYGAATVVVSEPQPERRRMAIEQGANHAVDPSELHDLFGDVGPDIAFVDVGVPALVEQNVALLRKGGRCVIFAGMPPESRISFDPNFLHYREIDLIGSSGSKPELQAEVLAMGAAGRLNLRALVSDVLPFVEWEKGFTMKKDTVGLKVLLQVSG
jgi:L-iditol 2-dehydrogenase